MSDDDEIDLSALDDDELVEQMHDDLYNGLKEEIEEGTRILLGRKWGPDLVLERALVHLLAVALLLFRIPERRSEASAPKVATNTSSTDLNTKAFSYFQALFTRPEATGLTVNATYTSSDGNKVVVVASANVKTNFMGLMGFPAPMFEQFLDWEWDILHGGTREKMAAALSNILAYLRGFMAEKEKNPDDGLVSSIVHGKINGVITVPHIECSRI